MVLVVWTVFVGGALGFLIGLAVLIGQMAAQEAAWRAIARERRELDERERACPACRRRVQGSG